MKHPVEGKPVSISGYFKGDMSTHLVGVLGVLSGVSVNLSV